MLPGPMAFWIVGGLSAAALGVMGVFSYDSYKKEQARKVREHRHKLREQIVAESEAPIETAVSEPTVVSEPIAVSEPTPVAEPVPVKAPAPTTTRNDFDFKF